MCLYYNIIQRLDSLYEDNPNKYWTLVKEIKDYWIQSEEQPPKISSEIWVNHFSTLFSIKEEFKRRNLSFEHCLPEKENVKSFTDLDFKIIKKEIHTGFKKSSVLDLYLMTNEMIKCGQTTYARFK